MLCLGRRCSALVLLVALATAALNTPIAAQTPNGRITGVVRDSAGVAREGATVRATSATGATASARVRAVCRPCARAGHASGTVDPNRRAERARRIREHAAKAAPKIQLVVALLLVPSVLLLVAAALVGAFVA